MTTSKPQLIEVNGHTFETVVEFEGDRTVQCLDCGARELIQEDNEDDPEDYLELMSPDECKRVVIREADGGFHGLALRNASGFQGRLLEAFDEDGEVQDSIRIYDKDIGTVGRLLDRTEWERTEAHL